MNLVARTALTVGLVSAVMVALVGTVAYVTVQERTLEVEQSKAAAVARGATSVVETHLRQAEQSLESMSRNTVIRSALLDSAGREVYIRPLLEGLTRIEGRPVSVGLLDYRAEPVLQAGAAATPDAREGAWLRQRIETGTPGTRITSADGAVQTLTFAHPVLLGYTGTTEGAVVMRIPAAVLLSRLDAAPELRFVLRPAGDPPPASSRLRVPLDVRMPNAEAKTPLLALDVEFVGDPLAEALARLRWQYAVGGTLCVALLVGLSVLAARRIAHPIGELVAMAQRVAGSTAESTPIDVPASATGEVRMLAESLRRMLQRLQDSARAEQQALQSQFQAIFEGTDDGAVITDAQGTVLTANPVAARLLGQDAAALRGSVLAPLLGVDHAGPGVVALTGPDGTVRQVEWTRSVFVSGGRTLELHRLLDVTERLTTAAALREAHDWLRAVLSAVPDLWFVFDAQGRHAAVSDPDHPSLAADWRRMRGLQLREVAPGALAEHLDALLRRARDEQRMQQAEYRLTVRGGEEREFEARIVPMRDGQLLYLTRDITDLKRSEAQLQSALRQKEVLLKEIYHRVKNNLQVVSSLLHMQERTVDDANVRRLFSDSAQRVESMALVHEQLYGSQDLSNIALDEYLRQLASHLAQVNLPRSSSIPIELDLVPMAVGIETAIPLGLVVTELVSNAYKHAYPARASRGRIRLHARRLDGGHLCLHVADGGAGLPAGFDIARCESLGMRLVSSLSEQLGGTLRYGSAGGAWFELSFMPEMHEASRLNA